MAENIREITEEEEVEYGTVAVVPLGEWDETRQYEVANLVTRDGSSFIAHLRPPVGTPPTDLNYWQVSAQGTSRATMDSLGTVRPDGATIEVNDEGTLSVKTATQTTPGIIKGSSGIKIDNDSAVDVNTTFEQATELANIIAGEAIASVLGKVSKAISATMSLDQNALLKNMLTNIDINDQQKVPTSAYIHTLTERIGMSADLNVGVNLTDAVNVLNQNLDNRIYYTKYAAALQAPNVNNTIYRLQVNGRNGDLNMYVSRDGGSEWHRHKTIDVQSGSASVRPVQDETVEFKVTFGREFNDIPQVVICPYTTGPQYNSISVGEVTKAGFTGYLYRNVIATTDMIIRWIAVA